MVCSSYWLDITWTLMLPISLVVMVMVSVQVVRHVKWTTESAAIISFPVATNLAVQLYHVMQTLAYIVMATLIMRLKSFLTPQLSVMCGILPAVISSKVCGGLGGRCGCVLLVFPLSVL